MIVDLEKLNANTSGRIIELERGKVDLVEAEGWRKSDQVVIADIETRLRKAERWQWLVAGALLVINIAGPIILKLLHWI